MVLFSLWTEPEPMMRSYRAADVHSLCELWSNEIGWTVEQWVHIPGVQAEAGKMSVEDLLEGILILDGK